MGIIETSNKVNAGVQLFFTIFIIGIGLIFILPLLSIIIDFKKILIAIGVIILIFIIYKSTNKKRHHYHHH